MNSSHSRTIVVSSTLPVTQVKQLDSFSTLLLTHLLEIHVITFVRLLGLKKIDHAQIYGKKLTNFCAKSLHSYFSSLYCE